MVRAKFRVSEKTLLEQGGKVKLTAVSGGSEEDKEFFKYTPGGSIEMQVLNDTALAAFEPGKFYYVDFTSAE